MSGGDCYLANYQRFVDSNNQDEVLVHANREFLGKGTELWGGHAFILNTKTNMVLDYSNGARLTNGGQPLIADKEQIYDVWGITEKVINGDRTYFEYTQQDAVNWITTTWNYGPWELLLDNWEAEGWGEYMKYFVPTFMPKRYSMEVNENDRQN